MDGEKAGKCHACGKIFSAHNTRVGTSLLWSHHKHCRGEQSGASSSAVSHIEPLSFRRALVEYFVSTDQSFAHIESKGFVRFLSYCIPNVQIMSRKALRADILKWFLEENEKMKASISSGRYSVALISDIWTGESKMDFMSVVVHNIDDDWNLNKRIISFPRIEGSHTSQNILDIMVSVIAE